MTRNEQVKVGIRATRIHLACQELLGDAHVNAYHIMRLRGMQQQADQIMDLIRDSELLNLKRSQTCTP